MIDLDFRHYAQNWPEFRVSLDVLERVLDFQSALEEKIESQLQIPPTTAFEIWGAGRHLLENKSLSISPALVREALAKLRSLSSSKGSIQIALDQLSDSGALTNCRLQIGDFDVRICDPNTEDQKPKSETLTTFIQQVASDTGTDPESVAFLFQTLLSPLFKKQARPYQEWVALANWRGGTCPVCGSEPWLARLSPDDGRRILACSLCYIEWPFDRLRCPFCAGNGQPQLRHFTVEGDEAHRVDCCDHCRRFIKTVDERVLAHPANLAAEDVITAHLDVLAHEQGYT